jgi:hypothetical protein
MTDLGERFRGLDRLPAPDLRWEIRHRTPSDPLPGSDRRRLGPAVAAVLVAAAGLAIAGRAFLGDSGDGGLRTAASLASPDERAGTVAIAALTEAGLHDYAGTFYDYVGIRREQDGWIASFCGPSVASTDCKPDATDAFLTIVPDGEDIVVAEASGAFSEEQRTGLLGYREPAAPPPARWIHRPIVPGTIEETNTPGPRASSYWTGAIPSNLGSLCRFEILDAKGEVVFATPESVQHPPESEGGRDSWTVVEIPPDVQAAEGRVVCGEWLPLQALPGGPRHVLASGTFAAGENEGQQWRLVAWRGENTDDPDVLEVWRLNAEGQDVYCWQFDTPSHASQVFGQRVAPGSCSSLKGQGKREALGARMHGALGGQGSEKMAVGDVSTDVAALEFRLSDGDVLVADLLDPPAELDLPRRFYVQILPPGANGEMVALDVDGKVLATEPLGRDESG